MNLIEDIHHFLMECTAITNTRKNILGLQRPYLEDEDRTISEFLLFGHKTEETIYTGIGMIFNFNNYMSDHNNIVKK